MKTVALPAGERVPAFGLGTWNIGDSRATRGEEIAALRLGMALGVTLIDTAEMYGDGGAEEVVARALAGRRDQVFVVSKVYPQNAGRKSAISACERSLRRLKTDRLDLYLLHWRGKIPLAETVEAFERLRDEGKILVGAFTIRRADMRELFAFRKGNGAPPTRFSTSGERGIEWELLQGCGSGHPG